MNEIIAKEVRVQQFNPWPRKREERRHREREERNKERQALHPFISGRRMEKRGRRWLSQHLFSPEELLFPIWDLASFNKQASYSLTTRIQSLME